MSIAERIGAGAAIWLAASIPVGLFVGRLLAASSRIDAPHQKEHE